MLEGMLNHLRRCLHDHDDGEEEKGVKKSELDREREVVMQAHHQSTTNHGIFTPTHTASTPSSSSTNSPPSFPTHSGDANSPRHLMSHLWTSYAKPFLHALRSTSACATDRIRVLYNSYHHLQRQRQLAEAQLANGAHANNGSSGGGFLLGLRASPPPVTPRIAANMPTQAELQEYVLIIQEWQHVRHQALLLLKQTLVSETFAATISECVAKRTTIHSEITRSPSLNATSISSTPTSSPSTSSFDPSSPSAQLTLSWSSTAFWQLCLDEILFPLLRDLAHSASQPFFLESSSSFTLCRTLSINLLSKVFLRLLTQLLQSQSLMKTSFTVLWLNVLKTMDRYMSIGVQMQRQQTARINHGQSQGPNSTGSSSSNPSHSSQPGLIPIPGIEWSGESGVQLTEAVGEALKNLVLVMKAQGVFNTIDTSTNSQAPSSSENVPPPASVPASIDPASELWYLTTAVVKPWLAFIPELQREIEGNTTANASEQSATTTSSNGEITTAATTAPTQYATQSNTSLSDAINTESNQSSPNLPSSSTNDTVDATPEGISVTRITTTIGSTNDLSQQSTSDPSTEISTSIPV